MIKLLLDRGADINMRSTLHGSALGAAAFGGHRRIIQLLLDRGADVNLKDSTGCNIAFKEAVAAFSNERTVEMLVRAGARVKVGSMDRVTFNTPCCVI
jgi:ankyrin repeat protein